MVQDFSFKKGFNSTLLIERIKACRTVGVDGRISFKASEFNDWSLVIHSALQVGDRISPLIARRVIWHVLSSQNLSKDFSVSELERECRKKFASQNKNIGQKFVVLFEFTVLKNSPMTWVSATNSRVFLNPSMSSNFMKRAFEERERLREKFSHSHNITRPKKPLIPVTVHVMAADAQEAYYKASDGVDEVRGLINFLLNYSKHSRRSSGLPKSVNDVKNGPLTTVHKISGDLASESFWFEHDWYEPKPPISFEKNSKNLGEQFRFLNKSARRKHGLRDAALTGLRQYCRALDQTEWQNSFLHLWTILEFLTNIENADYERLVDRAAATYQDYSEMREIGRHLRYRRNQIVHTALQDEDSEQLIFQAKRLVEPLILLYVRNSFRFESRADVAEFLDLPQSDKSLHRKRKLIEAAEKFRS